MTPGDLLAPAQPLAHPACSTRDSHGQPRPGPMGAMAGMLGRWGSGGWRSYSPASSVRPPPPASVFSGKQG